MLMLMLIIISCGEKISCGKQISCGKKISYDKKWYSLVTLRIQWYWSLHQTNNLYTGSVGFIKTSQMRRDLVKKIENNMYSN